MGKEGKERFLALDKILDIDAVRPDEAVPAELEDIFKKYVDKKYPIRRSSSLVNDLWFDSLDTVSLMMDLENKYGIKFDEKENITLITVEDVIKQIKKHGIKI
jgi:acyl carrier protein